MRIGDLSKLAGVKAETIRYYENEGIVRPSRNANGTFREYNMWDVLELLECLKYRHMDFTLNEVKLITKQGDLNDILDLLDHKEKELYEESTRKLLLFKKIKELSNRICNAPLNIGNYWFKIDEERIGIICTERNGKDYKEFDVKNESIIEWTKVIHLTKTYIRFSIEEINKNIDHNIWYHTIDAESFSLLNLPKKDIVIFPKRMYLHTIIDLGEKLQLSNHLLEPVIEQVHSKGLEIEGDIIGDLMIRFYEKGKWHRYVELLIPVK